MKNKLLQMQSAKLFLFCAAFSVFFSAFALTARAQTTTFAQYLSNGGGQDYIFSNNAGGSGAFATVTGGAPIRFFYENISGLDASLAGLQNAHLSITTTTTTPSTLAGGTRSQPLNQMITITITRDTPAPVGSGTRTILLRATIMPNTNTPNINGSDGGNSATLNASESVVSPDANIVFTSDFVNFSVSTARNLGLSFSSVTSNFSMGSGGFLNPFTAAGTGTFASNPAPIVLAPTAAAVAVSGRVLSQSGRGLSGASVNLTEEDGASHTVVTDSRGSYRFLDLPAGQNVFLTVNSSRFSYNPKVITLTEDVNNLYFMTEQSDLIVRGAY